MEKYQQFQQNIQETAKNMIKIHDQIGSWNQEFDAYRKNDIVINEEYKQKANEKEEEAIRRAASYLDKVKGIIERKDILDNKSKEALTILEETKKNISEMINKNEEIEIVQAELNNQIVDEILRLEESKMKRDIQPDEEEIKKINEKIKEKKNHYENRKKELERDKKNVEEKKRNIEEKKRKEQEETTTKYFILFQTLHCFDLFTFLLVILK